MRYINKEKIDAIKLTNNNFYVAIDFDRTITSTESVSSWGTCEEILGEEFCKRSYELAKKYEPIELEYNISFEEKCKAMEAWAYGSMDVFYDFGLTLDILKESIDTCDIMFRAGAKEFLENMYKQDITVVILSAGVGNVIEMFLDKNNCYYDNIFIISNFIEFDENGKMKQYNGNIIHTLNKTMKGHIEDSFSNKLKNREYRLLLGDFIEDKNMVPAEEWDNTISVRFLM